MATIKREIPMLCRDYGPDYIPPEPVVLKFAKTRIKHRVRVENLTDLSGTDYVLAPDVEKQRTYIKKSEKQNKDVLSALELTLLCLK